MATNNMRRLNLNFLLLAMLAVFPAAAQTNPAGPTNVPSGVSTSVTRSGSSPTNQMPSHVQRAEQVRDTCIASRRSICGRILKVLPDGLVVESGYTNLMRAPLTRSWLVPGTVTASRAVNLVESREPGAVCIGTVFLTDLPKARGHKPKQDDYVIIEGYPAGQYTYTSVGTVRKTVRRFSTQLARAVDLNLQAEYTAPPSAAGVK